MTLRTESRIAQTWATRRKAFTAAVTTTFAAWFAITTKAWLVAKLAAWLAIAAATCGCNFGAFLAWAVITAHSNHRAWCRFGFDRGNFGCWLCGFCRVISRLLCVCFDACFV